MCHIMVTNLGTCTHEYTHKVYKKLHHNFFRTNTNKIKIQSLNKMRKSNVVQLSFGIYNIQINLQLT
jgi:hypothetical protein